MTKSLAVYGVTLCLIAQIIAPPESAFAQINPLAKTVQRAEVAKQTSNAKQISLACRIYAIDNGGLFPQKLDELVPDYLTDKQVLEWKNPETKATNSWGYIGGLNDSKPAKTVLVYSPDDFTGKRIVVYTTSLSAVLTEKEFQALQPTQPTAKGRVRFEIDFPKPLTVGVPRQIKVANLEASPKKIPTSVMAPKGAKNLAEGKKVSSTDDTPIFGELSMVTDGDKDGKDGSYVELSPGHQHVTIDLAKDSEIHAVCIWHWHKSLEVYHSVVVEISKTEDFKKAKTIYNSDISNTLGFGKGTDKSYLETNMGRIIQLKRGVKGRFVRLHSKGNTSNEMNHYVEVEVWGVEDFVYFERQTSLPGIKALRD